MTSGLGMPAPPIPQWGTEADRGSVVRPHRHPDGADGARPERASKYGLLAPQEPAGDPAAVETQVRGEGHEATMGKGDQEKRETETGDRTRQRALLSHSIPEDANKELRPPERQLVLNMCDHQGEEGGGVPLNQQRAPTAHSQGTEGNHQTQ